MGLFSSKKKHLVDTSVIRVIEDNAVPSILRTSVVEAIFDDISVSGAIQNNALNSSFRNFERMYRFARDGKYAYGLPDASVVASSDGFPLVRAAIEADEGRTIDTIEYIHFRPLNNFHAGWKHLHESLDYDEETNEIQALSTARGVPVYLEKLVAIYGYENGQEIEQSALGTFESQSSQAGATPARPEVTISYLRDLVATEEFVTVRGGTDAVVIHVIWDNDGVIERDEITVSLEAYDTDTEYYQARYRYEVPDGGSTRWVHRFWIYSPLEKRFPDLDAVLQRPEYTGPGTYFPFVVFRSDGQNRAAPEFQNTTEYASTARMLDIMGMDFQEVADSVHENPDIEDIEQAVMLMAVPITTDDQGQIEYLHRYFKNVAERVPDLPPGSVRSTLLNPGLSAAPNESYALRIADADFDLTISFDSIKVRLRAKNLAEEYENSETTSASNPVLFAGGIPSGVENRNVRYIRRQVYPGVIEEIELVNPKFRYSIALDGEKGVEGGADDDRLLVPLDYEICKEMNLLKREDLYARSLNFVFNAYVVQKVKWYETGIFKALLVVVSIVIALYTGQWQTIAAAFGVGVTAGVLAIAQFLISYILKGVVFKFVLVAATRVLGTEFATALAVLAFAYGGYKGFKSGEFLQNATAQNMLTLGNGLINASSTVMGEQVAQYQIETQEFNLLAEAKMEELREMEKALDNGVDLDPFTFIGKEPLQVFGETPDAYFSRTSGSGNVGVQSLQFVQNFVDASIRLPEISDTLGNSFYAT